MAALQGRIGRVVTGFLRRPPRPAGPPPPLLALSRPDAVWAGATAALSAVLFATILTGHAGLGDAPEAVAGVASLGILHDPGYPAYVLIARAFTLLVPIGGEALRVNLFSVVCASASVAGVQLLARRCGAARWASSLGALALAATAGFWFYAGFAKHDIFSGLLFLVALHLALAWQERPTTRRLVALAAVIGLGLGSSWPLIMLLTPTVAFILFVSRRRLSLRSLALSTAAGLAVVVVVYGFVMVRAAQNPPVNWGDATSISRLVNLIDRADFTPHGSAAKAVSSGSAPGKSASTGRPAVTAHLATIQANHIFTSVGSYGVIMVKEIGILGSVLAVIGLLVTLTRRRTAATYPLLITFAVNLIGAAAVVGPGTSTGIDTDLTEVGFLLGCYFVMATWLALGAGEVVEMGRDRLTARLRPPATGDAPRHGLTVSPAHWALPLAAAVIAAVVLVPSVTGHWNVAHRAGKPYADAYGSTILNSVPRNSAVFILGAELTDPVIYRQVVYHQRRDVVVIAADGLSYGWYRDELARRLGRPLPPATGDSRLDAARAVQALIGRRRVYLDPQTALYLGGRVGYRPDGLLAEALRGKGWVTPPSPAALRRNVLAAERTADMPDPRWSQWPNDWLERATYSTAALEVARAYYDRRDYGAMRSALLNVLAIEPQNQTAQQDIAMLNQLSSPGSGSAAPVAPYGVAPPRPAR